MSKIYSYMKKIILGVVAATFAITACNNTSKEADTKDSSMSVTSAVNDTTSVNLVPDGAPIMKFKEDAHNFGKIKEGEKVTYDFEFTNNGKTPLIISDAVATCGCTVPEWPKNPIAPGAIGKINVVFNSAGKGGLQDKVVTITANTIPAETKIHLIGEVEKAN